jgi:hypothetical protein
MRQLAVSSVSVSQLTPRLTCQCRRVGKNDNNKSRLGEAVFLEISSYVPSTRETSVFVSASDFRD